MKNKYTKIVCIVLFIICVIGVIFTVKYNEAEPVEVISQTEETQDVALEESTPVPETESLEETVTEESFAETESTTEMDLETTVTETEEALYTVIPIDPVTLYATANVNIRNLPDVSGDKVGALSYTEGVTATGTVKEFGGVACYWLEVTTANGLTGFVNGGYLVEEQPVPQTPPASTGNNNSNSNSNSGASQSETSGTGTATTQTPPANNNQTGLSGDGWTEDPEEIADFFNGATGGYKETKKPEQYIGGTWH